MMPGVVAGFPRTSEIQIVSAYPDGPAGGGYYIGQYGSISPAGASAIPNAPAVVGASGEILGVVYYLYEGATPRLEVTVRGNYQTRPFTGMSIDGGAAITNWTIVSTGDTSISRFRHLPASNPIPAGTRTLKFS